jgi:hypothetical protein
MVKNMQLCDLSVGGQGDLEQTIKFNGENPVEFNSYFHSLVQKLSLIHPKPSQFVPDMVSLHTTC